MDPSRMGRHAVCVLEAVWLLAAAGAGAAERRFAWNRCELTPLPGRQVSFQIDGVEKTRWHFGPQYPRPFFYPFNGPSGESLTRMGHPGAPNHDHHRSVWIAHADVGGVDFWSDQTAARIRQKSWYAYRDANDEAVMAVRCGWFDGAGRELLDEDVVAALRPMPNDEHALEVQIVLRPGGKLEAIQLGKTNFGLLAVRMAKTISVYFGGGSLTSSEGLEGEAAIFGKRARWMDYSGPVPVGRGGGRTTVVEGVTYFDHPENPRYPTYWHVREDGWMGASFCMQAGWSVRSNSPLTLRYLLYAHRGGYEQAKAEAVQKLFAARPPFEIVRSSRKHRQYEVRRRATSGQAP